MIISNQTSIPIQYDITGGDSSVIPPHTKISINWKMSYISINFTHQYRCHTGSDFNLSDLYSIVINTFVTLSDLNDDSYLDVTGEKVHFKSGYAYDRFFFESKNCKITNESLFVSDLSILQRAATITSTKESNPAQIIDYLLSGNFLASSLLFFLTKILLWANNRHFPWTAVILYWIAGLGIHIIGEQLYYSYLRKKQPKLQELHKYASITFITDYYSNNSRKTIAKNIRRL